MIFVTVGTHYIGFDRLIKKMDEISGKINDNVVMQIGNTKYIPKNTEWFKFTNYENNLDLILKSDFIICHGGAGTLLDILNLNKKVIVVPRMKEFNEVYDNHELELVEALKDKDICEIVNDIKDLESTIIKFEKSCFFEKNNELVNYLRNILKGFEHENCDDNV